jgi:hypothetical protein
MAPVIMSATIWQLKKRNLTEGGIQAGIIGQRFCGWSSTSLKSVSIALSSVSTAGTPGPLGESATG